MKPRVLTILALGLVAVGSAAAFGEGEAAVPPVTVRQGGREFTLRSLISGVSWTDSTRPPKMDETWSSLALFRVMEKGKPSPWEPVDVELRDGKGQRWTNASYANLQEGEEIRHWFLLDPPGGGNRDHVRPAPGDWKLRVEFFRTGGFAPEELWTVKGVPLPKRGQEQHYRVIESAVRKETRLSLRELVPVGGSYGEAVGKAVEVPGVSVVVEPKRDHMRVDLVSVKDDRGRPARAEFEMGGSGSDVRSFVDPARRYHFSLVDLKPDARKVDLTFALHASEIVEFPVRYTPGSP